MKRRSLVVHAVVIAAGAVVAISTAIFTAPPAAVVAIGACFVAIDVAALLVVNRLQEAASLLRSQEKAFVRLVQKVAIDQSHDYYAPIVPAEILAAARLPVYVYPDDEEWERQS